MLSRDTRIALVAFLAGAGVALALVYIYLYLIPSEASAEEAAARLLPAVEEDEWVTAKGEEYAAALKAARQAGSIVGYVLVPCHQAGGATHRLSRGRLSPAEHCLDSACLCHCLVLVRPDKRASHKNRVDVDLEHRGLRGPK